MAHQFGSHLSMAGGHHKAVREAHALGMETVQVFTKSNNQWRAAPLTESGLADYRQALRETGLARPVAHASYLINLASLDDALWKKSIDALVVELERSEALGIGELVMHPGAHVGAGEEAGIERVAAGLDEVHRRTKGLGVRVALETTAGQGSCLGHRFDHLGRILDGVAEPERLSVCGDTCHIFAAGYPMGSPAEYSETMDAFVGAVGAERIRVWHLNDSQKPLGSRVDRHAGIGEGHLGIEPFRHLVNDVRFRGVPMILETPKGDRDGRNLDQIHLATLRGLIKDSR